MHIEFREEMEKLRFEEEHILGKKPMQIDLLIIKMKTEEKIRKNIGKIFREHNIIEYKSPEDYLSINNFIRYMDMPVFIRQWQMWCFVQTDVYKRQEGTRNKKVQDMQNRIEIMEKAKPILAVSIHQNSYTEESVKGPQVFYYETSAEGQKLAVNIQSALNTELSTERPRKEKGNTSYFLLKKSPCVLNIVECGFLTNKKEAELLQTEEYQQKIVEAVVKGIVQYMEGK